MSRKSARGKRTKATEVEVEAVEPVGDSIPEEVLAEGSGGTEALEGEAAHVGHEGIDAAGTDVEPPKRRRKKAAEPSSLEEVAAAALASTETANDEEATEPEPEPSRDDDDASVEPEAVEAAAGDAVDPELDPEVDPEVDPDLDPELAASGVLPTSAASMEPQQLKCLVEALVFASDKPLTVQRLRQLTRVSDTQRLEDTLAELAVDYAERGLVLQQVSGGYQFRTRSQFSVWVQQLVAGRPVRLSRAQLETLAIVAYRQPITRPEIDEIRGVDSSGTLKVLIDRALIRILGKREEVGRPMLYGTTKEFLDFFSLGDLRELPTLREYSELTDESRRVMSDRLGIDPDDGGNVGGGGAPPDDTAAPASEDDEPPTGANMDDFVAAYIRAADAVDASELRADADGLEVTSETDLDASADAAIAAEAERAEIPSETAMEASADAGTAADGDTGVEAGVDASADGIEETEGVATAAADEGTGETAMAAGTGETAMAAGTDETATAAGTDVLAETETMLAGTDIPAEAGIESGTGETEAETMAAGTDEAEAAMAAGTANLAIDAWADVPAETDPADAVASLAATELETSIDTSGETRDASSEHAASVEAVEHVSDESPFARGSAPVRAGEEGHEVWPGASGRIPAFRAVDESSDAGQGLDNSALPESATTDEGIDSSLE